MNTTTNSHPSEAMQRGTPTSTLRLLLSAEQSAAIRESGIRFGIIHPDSWPSPTVGRWVVDLIECDVHAANSAVRVALGQARAVNLKKDPVD
jgi:hypothetical protein